MSIDEITAKFKSLSEIRLSMKEEKDEEVTEDIKKRDNQKVHQLSDFLKLVFPDEFLNLNSLTLSGCSLSTLSEASINLNLKELILAHNNLQEVPSCIYAGLKKLELLDLSDNKITLFDMVPDSIGTLKIVNLSNNNFKNVPKWFLMFRGIKIEEFDYSTNRASHYNYLKTSYNRYRNQVKRLKLNNCQLVDKNYNFLKCFKLLEYLDISNTNKAYVNRFNEIDNLFVKTNWNNLQVLKVNNLSLALFPEGIAWIESLVELYIANNNITWLPVGIQFLIYLEVLDISNNDLVGFPNEIKKLEALRVLKAPSNGIETLPDLKSMKNLRVLDMYDNLLEGVSFNIKNILHIDLERNYLKTGELECPDQYNELKNNFTKSCSLNRLTGFKMKSNNFISAVKSNEECNSNQTKYFVHNFEEDNWDSTVHLLTSKNPDIDSVDENWDGEFTCSKFDKRNNFQQEKIYVADEDWMFEDVYEVF